MTEKHLRHMESVACPLLEHAHTHDAQHSNTNDSVLSQNVL
jgi:hypothetical protein